MVIGLVKFDLFGLGMFLVLYYVKDLVVEYKGIEVDLVCFDFFELVVYEMLVCVDFVGVF